MQTVDVVLPLRPHVNQRQILDADARFKVVPAGRRLGKTAVHEYQACIMVMEGKSVWWVNPTFDNTKESFERVSEFFRQVVSSKQINKSRREIVVPQTGGRMRFIGANNFKRGPGVDHIFVDEAAFIPELLKLWHKELEPMLLDTTGGASFFSSTNGQNDFFKVYQWGLDEHNADWGSWRFTSYDNPEWDPAELDAIRRRVPDRYFRQEYLAEFLEDGGAVFRNLKACVYETTPDPMGGVVFGVDLGRHNDYTVITALDSQTGAVLEIDRFTDTMWSVQEARLKAMANRWRPYVVLVEENFNDKFAEDMSAAGLPIEHFRTTNASKQRIVNALTLAFEQGDIAIPNDELLISELQSYTIEQLPSGAYRYGAPAGMHDDMVMSLALAWHAAFGMAPVLMVA